MILTCPECATSYFVDDSRIPPSGRRVRCSSCAHRWLAGPDGPMAEHVAAAPPEPAFAAAPAFAAEAAPETDIQPPAPDDVGPIVAPLRQPATRTARAPARDEGRSGALIWAGVAAVAAALIAGVIVFREQIVRVWPKSSAAYAGLGFPVEAGGLVLEQVHVEPAFLAGRPVLAVTGAIRNVRDTPVNAPPVRLTLLNRAGQPVAAKIARPADPAIPAGGKRHFAVTMLDPPATARDLEVRFESAGEKAQVTRAALTPTAPAAPAAPATPVEAAGPPPPPAGARPAGGTGGPAATSEMSPAARTEHG